MPRKLILSLLTYDWIPHTAGMIAQNSNEYELVVIYRDIRPIFWIRNLCTFAILEQRRHDLFCIGKRIGLKKISNLQYLVENIYLEKFITELHLYIMLNNIQEVYFQNNIILVNIFRELKKKYNIQLYIYGECSTKQIKNIMLSKYEYQEKTNLKKLMVGINNKSEINVNLPFERFYEVK